MKRTYTRRKPLGAHWPRFNLRVPVGGPDSRRQVILEHHGYNDERSGLAVHVVDTSVWPPSESMRSNFLLPRNKRDRRDLARIVRFMEQFAAAYRWEEKHPPEGRKTR